MLWYRLSPPSCSFKPGNYARPSPWPSGIPTTLYAVGWDSIPCRVILKTAHAISLLSIQHFGKEHGGGTYRATRWSAPNCSIHCASTAVWPQRLMKRRWVPPYSPKMAREGTLRLTFEFSNAGWTGRKGEQRLARGYLERRSQSWHLGGLTTMPNVNAGDDKNITRPRYVTINPQLNTNKNEFC